MKKILGIDGGGTRTAWMLLKRGDEQARSVSEGKLPPSNLRLTRPEQIISIFREMPTPVDRVGAFLAGLALSDEAFVALKDYIAYFGTYTVDEKAGTVIHHRHDNLQPGEGGDLQRLRP